MEHLLDKVTIGSRFFTDITLAAAVHPQARRQFTVIAVELRFFGALPVVKDGVVVGIISERDYARKIMLKGLSSVTTKVHEVMSSPVITVDTHKKVDECMNIMTDSHLRHLPVVEDGKLLGLLSIGDLVKEAIADQADLIKQLEQYIRGE